MSTFRMSFKGALKFILKSCTQFSKKILNYVITINFIFSFSIIIFVLFFAFSEIFVSKIKIWKLKRFFGAEKIFSFFNKIIYF